MEQEFICPNCGSTESKYEEYVSKEVPDSRNQNPWNSVLQIITCKKCHRKIPAHLGKRWDNISIEDAKNEWEKEYQNYKEK
jgi:RNA polymerase subunit RPABC4/transcription elongation factor Spt4